MAMLASKAAMPVAIYVLVSVLLLIAHVVLYVNTYTWIQGISSAKAHCECAKDWRRTYVLVFPPVALLLSLVTPAAARLFVVPLLVAGWIVFIMSALGYVKRLREVRCECATAGSGDEYLQVYAYLPIVAWTVSILFMLVTFLVVARGRT